MCPYGTVWNLTRGQGETLGFEHAYYTGPSRQPNYSRSSRQRNYPIIYASRTKQLKGQGLSSHHAYQEDWAKRQGHKSFHAYEKSRDQQRQQRPLNQIVSALIGIGLTSIDKDQNWLAEELEITPGIVSRYSSGKTLPRRSLQPKFFESLGLGYKTVDEIPYKTLNDLIENPRLVHNS